MVMLDPFEKEADQFGQIVQNHIIAENKWQVPIKRLIEKCKQQSHLFPSLIGMMSVLVEQEKNLTALIEPFTITFDNRYLQSEKVRMKDILNVASILFNNCNSFPKDYTSDLVNIALNG